MFGNGNTNSKTKNDKPKVKYKLIIDGNEYINTGCTTDLSGNRFCIFERRKNGFCIDRVKFAKKDLEIDHKTGKCRLKVKV